jgi:hypothetical protein
MKYYPGFVPGKTKLLESLVCDQVFCLKKPIQQIHWCYDPAAYDEKLFGRLRANCPSRIQFHSGFPAGAIEDFSLFGGINEQTKLLIVDDLFSSIIKLPLFERILTTLVKHQNISFIVTTQNPYSASSRTTAGALSTLWRNCSYLIFKHDLRTRSVVRQVAQFLFPGETQKILAPYDKFVRASKYSSLVIDLVTDDDRLVVRMDGITRDRACYGFKNGEICNTIKPEQENHTGEDTALPRH